MIMRQARLTGVYYHAAPTLLDKQLKSCFSHSKGPGDLPVKPKDVKDAKPLGVIVPMYAYDVAGPCAAWA